MPAQLRLLLTAALCTCLLATLPTDAQDAPDAEAPLKPHSKLELAQYCLKNNLIAEARKLANALGSDGAKILAQAKGKDDRHTADAWGGYLDRREAGLSDKAPKGYERLEGVGILRAAEAKRLKPFVIKLADAPRKQERVATWDEPWVIVGEHFTFITDLKWSRALKYSRLLDKFHAAFMDVAGDYIPPRKTRNRVWCCAKAEDFVSFSASRGHPFSKNATGLHVGWLGEVFINAERADYVGKKNRAKDHLARTLYHECTHRLVESGLRGRGQPGWGMAMTREHAWIVESIAVIFENLKLTGKKYKLKGLEAQRTYTIKKFWKGEKGKIPDLKSILRQGHGAFASGRPVSSVQKYAVVGTVGWYCMFKEKEKYRDAYLGLLVDYYRLDTRCKDFKTRFGVTMDEFAKEWREYVK